MIRYTELEGSFLIARFAQEKKHTTESYSLPYQQYLLPSKDNKTIYYDAGCEVSVEKDENGVLQRYWLLMYPQIIVPSDFHEFTKGRAFESNMHIKALIQKYAFRATLAPQHGVEVHRNYDGKLVLALPSDGKPLVSFGKKPFHSMQATKGQWVWDEGIQYRNVYNKRKKRLKVEFTSLGLITFGTPEDKTQVIVTSGISYPDQHMAHIEENVLGFLMRGRPTASELKGFLPIKPYILLVPTAK